VKATGFGIRGWIGHPEHFREFHSCPTCDPGKADYDYEQEHEKALFVLVLLLVIVLVSSGRTGVGYKTPANALWGI